MENDIVIGNSVDVINAKLRQPRYVNLSDAELEQLLVNLDVSLALFMVKDGQLVRRD